LIHLRGPLVVGEYLRVCIQGRLVEVLVAALAGGLPKEVGKERWVAGVGGIPVIKWIGHTMQESYQERERESSSYGIGLGSGSRHGALDQFRVWCQFRASGVQRAAWAGELLCISHSSRERLISVGGAVVVDMGGKVR